MNSTRTYKRMRIDVRDGATFLDMGEMEIWDGADLALLREGMTQLIEDEDCRAISINMTSVKYIPSGFFGMLFDWHEKRGVSFWLANPQPNVKNMLWFRQFFQFSGDADLGHELQSEPKEPGLATVPPFWKSSMVRVAEDESLTGTRHK